MLFSTTNGAAAYIQALPKGHRFEIKLDAETNSPKGAVELWKQIADITDNAVSFCEGCVQCERHKKTPRHHAFTGTR